MRLFQLAAAIAFLGLSATAVVAQDRYAGATSSADQPATNVKQGQAAIDGAALSGKYCFIFFWREKSQQTDRMWNALQASMPAVATSAEVVSIHVADPAQKRLVDKYGVSRAPMPMVLAVAPCGAVTKGFTRPFNEAELRTALVSPCTAECMKALGDRKLVLLCVQHSSPTIKQVSLQKGVQDFTADPQYAKNSAVVMLNADDPAEAAFLKDLRVNPKTAAPVTVLMAPPGTVVASFTGEVTAAQLVGKLKSAQSNPCAGGKCGPGGCGPKK